MTSKVKSDSFWYNDISILIRSDRLNEFFPTKRQTLEERFNAIVRLSLYSSIILYYYHKNYKYLAIFVGCLLITYFIYINNPENEKRDTDIQVLQSDKVNGTGAGVEKLENDSDEKCTQPTLDNPFMNVTMKDMLNIDPKTQRIVDRPKACDTTKGEVKKDMDEMFNHNLFKDVNDVFGKMNSQRQFYTMPNTTIPNAQDDFAKWLYLNPKTCKEDQDYCLRYEDIRGKRQLFFDPTKNPVKKES